MDTSLNLKYLIYLFLIKKLIIKLLDKKGILDNIQKFTIEESMYIN